MHTVATGATVALLHVLAASSYAFTTLASVEALST